MLQSTESQRVGLDLVTILDEEKDWITRMLNTNLFVSRIRRRNRKKRRQDGRS